ncbi:MAG: DASS family sodium-coupled anion symporter [Verrucomicrobiae bacterium]|nr:DASS family sodium-coupled anion symporter [Verrucomicrobiae bacterium]NNJ85759.1 DASS family sodium-coupled anion symporter [Akkermansiaceae bacterium]
MPNDKETVQRESLTAIHLSPSLRKFGLIGIAFALFFFVRHCLPLDQSIVDQNPETVRTGLAILTLAAVLWLTEALPLALTAILIPLLSALTGVMDVGGSFSGFAHPLIFLFLGGFGLAASLSRQGLDRWLATKILALGRGKFHTTAIALFLVSALLSMWISNTATVALLLPVVLGILSSIAGQCGQTVADKAAPYLLLGIAYSASIGGIGTIIGTPPNAIAAAQLKISFDEWLAIGIPCVIILLPVLFVLLRILARPGNVCKFEVSPEPFSFTRKRILTLAIFLCAIAGWLFSSHLAHYLGIVKSFDTIVAITAVLVLAACRLVDWRDIDRATDWGVLLLFGGGITLSKILSNTGASYFLANQIQHLTQGWPLILFIGVVVIFVIFLTELSSNTASTALLVPIFAAVAIDMGVTTEQIVLPLTLAASCAFMLPVATPPNAIVFGSGKIRQREMLRIGLVLNLVFAVILTLIGSVYF